MRLVLIALLLPACVPPSYITAGTRSPVVDRPTPCESVRIIASAERDRQIYGYTEAGAKVREARENLPSYVQGWTGKSLCVEFDCRGTFCDTLARSTVSVQ